MSTTSKAKFSIGSVVRIKSLPKYSDRKLRKYVGVEGLVGDSNYFSGNIAGGYWLYTLMCCDMPDIRLKDQHLELVKEG